MVEGLTSRIQRYPLCESVCEATWHSGMTYVSTWFRSWKEIHFVLMEKKGKKQRWHSVLVLPRWSERQPEPEEGEGPPPAPSPGTYARSLMPPEL